MDNMSPTSSDRLRTNWTPSMDRYFIDLVLDQVHKGNMSDHSFRKQIWTHMISLFNAKFGFQYDKDVLRNRYKTLRRQYNDIKALLDQSGFQWDDTRQMVTADDNVWDNHIKAHPDVRSYRTKTLPYYNDMCMIYGNAAADGRNNSLGQDVDLDNDSPEMKIGGMSESLKSPATFIEDLVNNAHGDSSSYSFEDMMKRSTNENTIDAFSERETALLLFENMKKENESSILADDVQEDLSHPVKDVMRGRIEKGTVGALSEMVAAVSSVVCKKEEDDSSIRVNDVQKNSSQLGEDILRESMEESIVDACFDRSAAIASLTFKKRNNMGESLHLGENMVRGSTEEGKVDSHPEKAASIALLENDKENENCISVDNVEEHLGGNIARESTNKGVDTHPEKADTIVSLENSNKESETVISVNNVLDDSSHLGGDMVRRESMADAPSKMTIIASGLANEMKEIANPIRAESVICALEAVQYATSSSNRSRVTWTPTMDRYFIDLMLDQVSKGNKIGRSFNKQAWMDMTALFSTKFGVQYEKDVLKNRYKNLRRQYVDIKILLDQSGFGWDKKLQMVTADVRVWDDYIKEHSNARQYRIKPVPYYNDLCVIYGNAAVGGNHSFSGHDVNLDNDVPRMKIRVKRGRRSPAMSVAHEELVNDVLEESSHLGGDMGISGLQRNHQLVTPPMSQHPKRPRTSTDNFMVDALREMAIAVTSLVEKKKENDTSFSIENVIAALQAVPDIDEDLFLDACDFLEDEKKGKTFLALDASRRKRWLIRKLRPE